MGERQPCLPHHSQHSPVLEAVAGATGLPISILYCLFKSSSFEYFVLLTINERATPLFVRPAAFGNLYRGKKAR